MSFRKWFHSGNEEVRNEEVHKNDVSYWKMKCREISVTQEMKKCKNISVILEMKKCKECREISVICREIIVIQEKVQGNQCHL